FARYGDTFDTRDSGADFDIDDVYELVGIVDRLNGRAEPPRAPAAAPAASTGTRRSDGGREGEGVEGEGTRAAGGHGRAGWQVPRVRLRGVQRHVPARQGVRQRGARGVVPAPRAGAHLLRAGGRPGAVRPAVPVVGSRSGFARGAGSRLQAAAGARSDGR